VTTNGRPSVLRIPSPTAWRNVWKSSWDFKLEESGQNEFKISHGQSSFSTEGSGSVRPSWSTKTFKIMSLTLCSVSDSAKRLTLVLDSNGLTTRWMVKLLNLPSPSVRIDAEIRYERCWSAFSQLGTNQQPASFSCVQSPW